MSQDLDLSAALEAIFQQQQHLAAQLQGLEEKVNHNMDGRQQQQHFLNSQFQGLEEKLNNMDENRRQPLGHHLKPKQPPEFSGRNSKWSNNVVEWLFMVEQYFGIVSGSIQDSQAVRYAGTLLTENAASWWVSFRPNNPELSWDEFKTAITAEFQDINEAKSARDALVKIKQGTRNIQQYASEFRRIVRKLPRLDKDDQVYFFISGIQSVDVRRAVQLQNPKTLDLAIQAAHSVEQLNFVPPVPYANRFRAASPVEPPQQQVVPMEIGSISQIPRSALSTAERNELLRNNGCFYCRAPNAGHRAAQCPLKNRNFGRGQ